MSKKRSNLTKKDMSDFSIPNLEIAEIDKKYANQIIDYCKEVASSLFRSEASSINTS
jgi:hypothetical protein